MALYFRQWFEDCGPVTKDSANTIDSNSNSPLAYVKSNRMEGQRKRPKQTSDPEPEKLFGFDNKKMKK